MKITTFIILVGCLQVAAAGKAQNVSLSFRNAPLDKVFAELERQTKYVFFCEYSVLQKAKKVTIDVKGIPFTEALNECLKGQDLSYTFMKNTVLIEPKKQSKAVSDVIAEPLIDIKGRVVDEHGKPVAGVTVTVKGTKKQTITNENGEFSIQDVAENAVLTFSSVNMEAFTVNVSGQKEILAKLKTKTSELDEVQIIAYGQTTKRFQTGNVSTVKASEIERQPISNPLLALQGRVPGVVVTQQNGVFGGGLTIRVQGQNSIAMGADPLIIIDGVPYSSQNLQTFQKGYSSGILGSSASGSQGANGNPLNYVNPSDIESIEVLKDADATAIYGSRAANGAILITTKKGKAGQTKVDIKTQIGWGDVPHFIKLMNTAQYMEMRNEAIVNDNASILSNDYDLNGTWDTTRFTDWQKVLLGGTAKHSQYNLNISGGTSNIQYLIGGTYHKETTVFPGNFSNSKGAVHFSINSTSANQKFKISLSGNYMADNSNLPGIDLTSSIFLAPVAPALYNDDGSLNWAPDFNNDGNSSWTNPLSQLYNSFETKTNSLISSAVLSYRILEDLDFRTSLGYTSLESNQFLASLINSVKPEERANYERGSTFAFNNSKSWIVEPQLNYRKNVRMAKLDLLLGVSVQQQENDGKEISAYGQPNDQLLRDLSSATSFYSSNADISTYKYNAGFARINVNVKDRYIVNLNWRKDGSSRFGDKNRFHNFGSVGGAWIFSEEKFFKNHLPLISFGKLRGSYGITGNDQIGNYAYLNRYISLTVANPYQSFPSLGPAGLSNSYLQWEETRKLQFGVELGLLKDRIFLSTNFARNRSSNQILNYRLAGTTGFSSITSNFPATVQNLVWEFAVNAECIRSNRFSWKTSLNLTVPKNELVKFPNIDNSTYSRQLALGQPLEPLGYFKTFHYYGVDSATGIYLVTDQKGNPTSTPKYPDDLSIFVSSLPKFYGGIQNTFQYKGFQLDILFQFVKQKYFNFYSGLAVPGNFQSGNGNQPVSQLDRWRKPGDNANFQRFSTQYLDYSIGDKTIEDISYIRLKNLSLSYQVSKYIFGKIPLQNCNLFVNAQNLLTITPYKGLDPENMSYATLPPLRIITVGVQITL